MSFYSVPEDELMERVMRFKDEDHEYLYDIGHSLADEFYKVKLGTCTDITGYPYSGKSLFLKEVLFNTSVLHGLKHMIYMPDDGSVEEVTANMIHKFTGKTFNPKYPNVISPSEIEKGVRWFHKHFKIIDRNMDDNRSRPKMAPEEFWEMVVKDDDIHTGTIDSWNFLDVADNPRALAGHLTFRNELCQKYEKHFFTIIHPRNPTANDFDKEGRLRPPSTYNLMGGSEWNNNGKNIIVVHKEVKEGDAYDIYFRKIKPRIVGKTGHISLGFDIPTQKFYQVQGGPNPKKYSDATETLKKELRISDEDLKF